MAEVRTQRETPLEERLYSIGEAARFLLITSTRLRRWLEGGRIAGRWYEPVIRPEPTGDDSVTWAEFVEASLLREYRRRVSLQQLRPLIDGLRQEFGVVHPLAHFEPIVDVSRRELLVELQRLHHIDEELYLARPTDPQHGVYQIQWTAPVESWLERVEFDEEGVARRMRPMGPGDPVIIDPGVTFGIPQVRGIRTETLAEAYATTRLGVDEMASEWDMDADEIEAALRWELSLRGEAA
jgi:uncharacterized protein (DUF433 family)